VAIKSLTDGTSLPQSKFDLVMDTYDLGQSQEILALLARHDVPSVEMKRQTPFVLLQSLGLVDANIISEMLRGVPGTEVSLSEHKNEDGNLVLLDLIMESALNTNYLVELAGGDEGLKAVQKLQSRQ
jgi:hypothetical protein